MRRGRSRLLYRQRSTPPVRRLLWALAGAAAIGGGILLAITASGHGLFDSGRAPEASSSTQLAGQVQTLSASVNRLAGAIGGPGAESTTTTLVGRGAFTGWAKALSSGKRDQAANGAANCMANALIAVLKGERTKSSSLCSNIGTATAAGPLAKLFKTFLVSKGPAAVAAGRVITDLLAGAAANNPEGLATRFLPAFADGFARGAGNEGGKEAVKAGVAVTRSAIGRLVHSATGAAKNGSSSSVLRTVTVEVVPPPAVTIETVPPPPVTVTVAVRRTLPPTSFTWFRRTWRWGKAEQTSFEHELTGAEADGGVKGPFLDRFYRCHPTVRQVFRVATKKHACD